MPRLMASEDARLTVEGVVIHPDVGEVALPFTTAPGTFARTVARSLETTTRKGIVAHAVSHGVPFNGLRKMWTGSYQTNRDSRHAKEAIE
jgi:hypothetical protein